MPTFTGSKGMTLRPIGIDAYASIRETSRGRFLLIQKPSGQEWVQLSPHDFLWTREDEEADDELR